MGAIYSISVLSEAITDLLVGSSVLQLGESTYLADLEAQFSPLQVPIITFNLFDEQLNSPMWDSGSPHRGMAPLPPGSRVHMRRDMSSKYEHTL